jgi:hypothetical protein
VKTSKNKQQVNKATEQVVDNFYTAQWGLSARQRKELMQNLLKRIKSSKTSGFDASLLANSILAAQKLDLQATNDLFKRIALLQAALGNNHKMVKALLGVQLGEEEPEEALVSDADLAEGVERLLASRPAKQVIPVPQAQEVEAPGAESDSFQQEWTA